jgi:hypothetical protein
MDVQALRAEFRALRAAEADALVWDAWALRVFRFQAAHHPVYARFVRSLGIEVESIASIEEVPFLPVEAFVYHQMGRGETIFRSSGTLSGGRRAEHALDDPAWYDEVAIAAFERLYGPLRGWSVGGLLPGYLGRSDASLVHMVRAFGKQTHVGEAGLFDRADGAWDTWLERAAERTERVLVLGVTHALLAWEPANSLGTNVVLMETGGMKGMGRELIREEVHAALGTATGCATVESEYGMTECLSQAYARSAGRFQPPPWMRVFAVEVDDPGAMAATGRQGRLAIADLANLHSCCFLATSDLGRVHDDGTFEVLGRHDRSEVRGCNLML